MKPMRKRTYAMGWAAVSLALGMLLTSLGVAQADPPDRKLQREMRIFERVMDDMLIDSPNWLVPGRDNTRGYHVPKHGTFFTFQASLVNRNWGRSWTNLEWYFGRDDRDWDRDRDRDEDDDRSSRRSRGDREERLYERGKQEVIDVFLDFGDGFESLGGNEVITVVAYLDDADLFRDKDIRRLEMSAKVSDLRAYGSGSLSEEQMVDRIVTLEY